MIWRAIQSETLTIAKEPPAIESVDDRMVGLMRMILALSALVIIYIDPSEPARFVALTYGALVIHSLCSAVLCFLSFRRSSLLSTRVAPWIDVGCAVVRR